MELIIFRHGLAEEREEFAKKTGLEDHLRPLTLKGRKKTLKMAQYLKQLTKSADLIVTSPFTRSKQTAEIIQTVFDKIEVVEIPELVPQAPSLAFLKWLRIRGRTHKKIIVVGHEPHLSSFASYLLSGAKESFIELKKGGLCSIEFESFEDLKPGVSSLSYLVSPKIIDEL